MAPSLVRLDVILLAATLAACSRSSATQGAAKERPAAVVPRAAEVVPSALPFHEPTFARDVRPLLEKHCQRCHVRGGVAPFPLVTYAEAKDLAASIADETRSKRMPPWGARETPECQPRFKWRDDERLSAEEIAILDGWARSGAKEGIVEAKSPPPARGAKLGETVTVSPAAGFAVRPGATEDTVRCFVLDPKIGRPRFMTGSEFLPGNRSIVHHAIVFALPADAKTPHPVAYDCPGGPNAAGASLVAAWAPGGVPSALPPGVGLPVDTGTKLVLQVHYHPHAGASLEPDRTAFRMELRDDVPEWIMVPRLIGNFRMVAGDQRIGLLPGPADPPSGPTFLIPVDAPRHTETMIFTIPTSLGGLPLPRMRVLGVGAHMHLAGVDEKLTLKRSAPQNGEPREECLLEEPAWAFDWQRMYTYDAPLDTLPSVGPGDALEIRCTYDNSLKNLQLKKGLTAQGRRAVSPIGLGEGTLDEMCLAAVQLVMKR